MTNSEGRVPTGTVRTLPRSQPQPELFLMYGPTGAFRSTSLPSEEVDRRPRSIDRAIPRAEIVVLRSDGTRCATSESRELVHRGPAATLGYWNDPDLKAREDRPDPIAPPGTPASATAVYSGDLVRADEDEFPHYVVLVGRLIESMGFRVSPDAIAGVLHASGEILEGGVATEEDPAHVSRIVAHVVLRDGGSTEQPAPFCARELPRPMQRPGIDHHDSLPRTSCERFDVSADVRRTLAGD